MRRNSKRRSLSARFVDSDNSLQIPNNLPISSSSGLVPRTSVTSRYQVEAFQMPNEDGRLPASRPESAYAPSVGPQRLTDEPGSPPGSSRHLPTRTPTTSTSPSRSHQVYVVHHDSHVPPVTIYHQDGTQIVELPPRYPPTALSSLDEQVEGTSASASESKSDMSGRRDIRGGLSLHEARQPNSIQKPPLPT